MIFANLYASLFPGTLERSRHHWKLPEQNLDWLISYACFVIIRIISCPLCRLGRWGTIRFLDNLEKITASKPSFPMIVSVSSYEVATSIAASSLAYILARPGVDMVAEVDFRRPGWPVQYTPIPTSSLLIDPSAKITRWGSRCFSSWMAFSLSGTVTGTEGVQGALVYASTVFKEDKSKETYFCKGDTHTLLAKLSPYHYHGASPHLRLKGRLTWNFF